MPESPPATGIFEGAHQLHQICSVSVSEMPNLLIRSKRFSYNPHDANFLERCLQRGRTSRHGAVVAVRLARLRNIKKATRGSSETISAAVHPGVSLGNLPGLCALPTVAARPRGLEQEGCCAERARYGSDAPNIYWGSHFLKTHYLIEDVSLEPSHLGCVTPSSPSPRRRRDQSPHAWPRRPKRFRPTNATQTGMGCSFVVGKPRHVTQADRHQINILRSPIFPRQPTLLLNTTGTQTVLGSAVSHTSVRLKVLHLSRHCPTMLPLCRLYVRQSQVSAAKKTST